MGPDEIWCSRYLFLNLPFSSAFKLKESFYKRDDVLIPLRFFDHILNLSSQNSSISKESKHHSCCKGFFSFNPLFKKLHDQTDINTYTHTNVWKQGHDISWNFTPETVRVIISVIIAFRHCPIRKLFQTTNCRQQSWHTVFWGVTWMIFSKYILLIWHQAKMQGAGLKKSVTSWKTYTSSLAIMSRPET